ncbi:hypothetical protein [Pseudovibrio sp. Ad37]|uniref:hypothetical protein n=1 Tax=Pseudovibrio sp. Ad37 TaxID=989422 RepID=UPI0007AE49DD|nr:hypothetical protein [Pseudovibrio sp. Ad37]KZL15127.1 hypothetical protein PsAD37_04397 [Pseudovibrio sp. Ad37]
MTSCKPSRKKRKPAQDKRSYTRASALEHMRSKGLLSDLQYRVACQISALMIEQGGQTRSIDYAQPVVDGGGADRDWLFVSTSDATRKIKEIAKALGPDQAVVVFSIAGRSMSTNEVALLFEESREHRESAKPLRKTQDYVRQLLRDGLTRAAFHLGLAVTAPDTLVGKRLRIWRNLGGEPMEDLQNILSESEFVSCMAARFMLRAGLSEAEAEKHARITLDAFCDAEKCDFGSENHHWGKSDAEYLADEELDCWGDG